MLDVSRQYLLNGNLSSSATEHAAKARRPDVLHLRLSAETLAQLHAGEGLLSIANVNADEPMLNIGGTQHALHHSVETTPHLLYKLDSLELRPSSFEQLKLIGHIQSKLTVRQSGALPPSSATLKLKERREEEANRKSEHRAVLLSSAPVNAKSKPSSSLKLRAKGIAPSSPLMRSRAATPADGLSRAGSPSGNGATATLREASARGSNSEQSTKTHSSPLKRDVSPTGLRQAIVQLLANGPLSRREIAQNVQFAEQQVFGLLSRIAHGVERAQQSGSQSVRNSRSQPNEKEVSSTLFALNDEVWKEVLVRDWREYSTDEKIRISETMQIILDRQGVPKDAAVRKQIVRRESTGENLSSAAKSADAKRITAAKKADVAEELPASTSHSSKKPTTKERLAKAAKGKGIVSKPATTTTTAPTTRTSSTAVHRTTKESTTIASVPATAKKTKKNVSLDYTDSEGEEEGERVGNAKRSKATTPASSDARPRHGVGRGANMGKEPWLDVRSVREWHELAKRFHRTYGEYQTGLGRVREEETKLRSELQQVHAQEEQQKRQRCNSLRSTRSQRRESFNEEIEAGEEREEGEADVPLADGDFTWRSSQPGGAEPMPLEEMDSLVTSILELEGQLRRMKSALQTSKKQLET